ncbi:hypothetical protein MKS88_002133 [Plasmodium brasilianum]|uniref:Uncharacterized protein n=1 Tax=Plasmodium brasilianum TaxID=5824 RepID=A0ACB9YBP5_PLABR|nr:hypothetical protein MKS88_002133 [Plasmodium brasilianum]
MWNEGKGGGSSVLICKNDASDEWWKDNGKQGKSKIKEKVKKIYEKTEREKPLLFEKKKKKNKKMEKRGKKKKEKRKMKKNINKEKHKQRKTESKKNRNKEKQKHRKIKNSRKNRVKNDQLQTKEMKASESKTLNVKNAYY